MVVRKSNRFIEFLGESLMLLSFSLGPDFVPLLARTGQTSVLPESDTLLSGAHGQQSEAFSSRGKIAETLYLVQS